MISHLRFCLTIYASMLSKIQVFVLFLDGFNLQKNPPHYNTLCIGLLSRTEVNCASKMENPISPRALLYRKVEYLHLKNIYILN